MFIFGTTTNKYQLHMVYSLLQFFDYKAEHAQEFAQLLQENSL